MESETWIALFELGTKKEAAKANHSSAEVDIGWSCKVVSRKRRVVKNDNGRLSEIAHVSSA